LVSLSPASPFYKGHTHTKLSINIYILTIYRGLVTASCPVSLLSVKYIHVCCNSSCYSWSTYAYIWFLHKNTQVHVRIMCRYMYMYKHACTHGCTFNTSTSPCVFLTLSSLCDLRVHVHTILCITYMVIDKYVPLNRQAAVSSSTDSV